MATEVIIFLVVLYIVRSYIKSRHWDHFPGFSFLTSLPIIGHAYKLKGNPLEVIEKCRQKFGSIFRLDIGNMPTVIICDYEDVYSILKSESFGGRPVKVMHGKIRGIDKNGNIAGVIFSHGQTNKELKKFMLQQLGELGISKKGK